MLTLSTRFRCKLISNAGVSAHHVPQCHILRVERVQPIWSKQARSHPYCRLSFDQFIYIASGCSLQLSWTASLAGRFQDYLQPKSDTNSTFVEDYFTLIRTLMVLQGCGTSNKLNWFQMVRLAGTFIIRHDLSVNWIASAMSCFISCYMVFETHGESFWIR